MRMLLPVVAVLCCVAAPATAAEYLDQVASPVFQAAGDREGLTRQATICLAQHAGAGAGQALQASDAAAGVVVGLAVFEYSQAGVPWSVRSTLTVEAKDGRFRLTHTGLQQKQGRPGLSEALAQATGRPSAVPEGGWSRIGKWRFSGHEKATAAAQALSGRVADCVRNVGKSDDW